MNDQQSATGKVGRAVESIWVKVAARGFMVLCLPTLGAIWSEQREIVRAINRFDVALTAVNGTHELLRSRIEAGERNATSRFDAHGRRIDRNDADIDKLKERVWSLPQPVQRGMP